MPDLSSKSLFSGSGEPNPTDLGNAEISNFHTSVDGRLRDQFKWKGKLAEAVGLILSPDNTKVINGVFLPRGSTGFKEIRIPCNRVWHRGVCQDQEYAKIKNVSGVITFISDIAAKIEDLYLMDSMKGTHAWGHAVEACTKTLVQLY